MTLVLINGCFNAPLHVGHIRILTFARQQGDRLIVAINSDISVKRVKGESRPVTPEEERKEILMALSDVDSVVIFDDDTPEGIIERIRPDVLVKGPQEKDQHIPGAAFVLSYGGSVVVPDWPVEHSTTGLIERIKAL